MAGRTRRQRSSRKRDQIREAAQRLFLSAGFASTTMDAITLEAGVSKQTVYVYYPSKEALLADVLQTLVAQRTAAWEAPADLAGPLTDRAALEGELRAFAGTVIDNLMQPEYLGMARVVVAESGRNPELGGLFRQAVAGPVIAGAARLIGRGAAGGLYPPTVVEEAARLLVGSLLTFILLDGLLRPDGPQPPPPGTTDRLVVLLLDGLVVG